MAEYAPPDWGADGANALGVYLEVIKSGVVLERLALPVTPGRSCVVAGRLPPPACDLELAHGSASRVHAALQFDARGALFLQDLGSTHGSFVNKQRVPPREFVRLRVGDVLAFGESSRLYAVCGPAELLPAEYDSQNLRALREKSETRQEKKAVQRQEQKKRAMEEEDGGASWGFREDAVEEDDDDESESDDDEQSGKQKLPDYLRNLKSEDAPYASSVKQSDVNDKDQKLFQQLQARIRKMENLKLEAARIEAKQHQLTGLTEGQEKTLARNEQRIQALRKEIESIEDRIHAKNAQREQTKSSANAVSRASGQQRRANETMYGYDSDEDDFYDRTASNQRKLLARKQQLGDASAESSTPASATDTKKKSLNGERALTAESIRLTIMALENELQEILREQDAAATAQPVALQEQKQEEEADSLDSFMASTAKELHATQLASIRTRRQEIEAELRRQQQLLAIATPALARVAAQPSSEAARKQAVSESSSASPDVTSTPVVPMEEDDGERKKDDDNDADTAEMSETLLVLPVKRPADPQTTKAGEDEAAKSAEREWAGDDATKRVELASSSTSSPPTKSDVSQAKKRRVVGPALGPPRAPSHAASAVGRKSAVRKDADAVRGESSVLEGGESVWMPPPDQTGDGRTKLNDKFGY